MDSRVSALAVRQSWTSSRKRYGRSSWKSCWLFRTMCCSVSITCYKTQDRGHSQSHFWNLLSLCFLIRKAIWKKKYPLLRVFCLDELHWHLRQYCWELISKASTALHGDIWGAPPFTPHLQQSELLSVKRQVSQEKGIISLHPWALFVCWFSDTVMVSVWLFNNVSYQKKTFC